MAKKSSNIQPVSTTSLDIYTPDTIQGRILTIRGQQVIMDADLAEFYQVKTHIFHTPSPSKASHSSQPSSVPT